MDIHQAEKKCFFVIDCTTQGFSKFFFREEMMEEPERSKTSSNSMSHDEM